MRYSRGSKTEPWGRPYGAGTHGDLVDPCTTQKERSPRNDLNQQRNAPVTPKDICNRSSNISWSTVSNAALTSKSASKVSCERSIPRICLRGDEVVESRWNGPYESQTESLGSDCWPRGTARAGVYIYVYVYVCVYIYLFMYVCVQMYLNELLSCVSGTF